jgi:hypothetical protein
LGEINAEFGAKIQENRALERGQVKRHTDKTIGAAWVLQQLTFKTDQFKNQVMEMKDKLNVSMD